MEALLIVVVMVVVIAGLMAGMIWGVNTWAGHVVHRAFCTCDHCRKEKIETEIRSRAWFRMNDDIRRAVDEVERVTRGH